MTIADRFQAVGADMLRFSVPAVPLDDLLKRGRPGRVDFIKIDVEGFELEVLKGSLETLREFKPMVYCEVNHWCLSMFRRIALPDFIEGVFRFFPNVFAIHSNLSYLDLSDEAARFKFYHSHLTKMAYMNLLCGFDKNELLNVVHPLSKVSELEGERERLRAELNAVRTDRDQMLASKSWKITKPLRAIMKAVR